MGSSLISPVCSHLRVCLNVLGFPGLAPIFNHCTGCWFGKVGISGRYWALSNALTPLTPIVPLPILADVGESEGGDYATRRPKKLVRQFGLIGLCVLWMAGMMPPCLVAF